MKGPSIHMLSPRIRADQSIVYTAPGPQKDNWLFLSVGCMKMMLKDQHGDDGQAKTLDLFIMCARSCLSTWHKPEPPGKREPPLRN